MAKAKQPEQPAEFDFERALQELEQLVERMEQGEATLEQSLQDFERGIELYRGCRSALKNAEQRVQVLMERDGREELEPFPEFE